MPNLSLKVVPDKDPVVDVQLVVLDVAGCRGVAPFHLKYCVCITFLRPLMSRETRLLVGLLYFPKRAVTFTSMLLSGHFFAKIAGETIPSFFPFELPSIFIAIALIVKK